MPRRRDRIKGDYSKGESHKEIARALKAQQIAIRIVSGIKEHELWGVISRYFSEKNKRPLPIQIAKEITKLSTERTLEEFQLTGHVPVADNIRNLMQQRTDLFNQLDELTQYRKNHKINVSEFEGRKSETEKNILIIGSQINARVESVIRVADSSFFTNRTSMRRTLH